MILYIYIYIYIYNASKDQYVIDYRDCSYPFFNPQKIKKEKETNRKRNSIYIKKSLEDCPN